MFKLRIGLEERLVLFSQLHQLSDLCLYLHDTFRMIVVRDIMSTRHLSVVKLHLGVLTENMLISLPRLLYDVLFIVFLRKPWRK